MAADIPPFLQLSRGRLVLQTRRLHCWSVQPVGERVMALLPGLSVPVQLLGSMPHSGVLPHTRGALEQLQRLPVLRRHNCSRPATAGLTGHHRAQSSRPAAAAAASRCCQQAPQIYSAGATLWVVAGRWAPSRSLRCRCQLQPCLKHAPAAFRGWQLQQRRQQRSKHSLTSGRRSQCCCCRCVHSQCCRHCALCGRQPCCHDAAAAGRIEAGIPRIRWLAARRQPD